MKLELVDRSKVGLLQKEAIERLSVEIENKRNEKLDTYNKVINELDIAEDNVEVKLNHEWGRLEVSAIGKDKDGELLRQEVGDVQIEEPFYYREDRKPEVSIKWRFNSLHNNYDWQNNDSSIVADAHMMLHGLIKAYESNQKYFSKVYRECEAELNKLREDRRSLERELNNLRWDAKMENYDRLTEALKNGLDIRAYMPDGTINGRYYINSRREIVGCLFKAIKVNKSSIQLQYQAQDRPWCNETHERKGELELTSICEARAKKEDFYDELLNWITKNVKDEDKQDTAG